MSESWFMPYIKRLLSDEWRVLRDIRLSALADSPKAFLGTYDQEKTFNEIRWRAEFDRGYWNIGMQDSEAVGLLGCTRDKYVPAHQRYLEYLWVAREQRNNGIAHFMLTSVLETLRQSGVKTAFLWVLSDNEAAMRLYNRVGFLSTNHRQPLAGRPGVSEERMQLDLE
jgi:ribosomal protein S18 acetylase RimI-like enzyme